MENNEVLDHLLHIEAEAAALVDNAQAEADKRLTEAEKKSRADYEDRYRKETERLESEYLDSKKKMQQHYREELNAYKEKISSVPVDISRFSALLDKLMMGEE
jgi:vacuolar-type H+-ATPase subunit H